MRSTLVVENEKMHHGHSDENSISLLMAGETILLHDGGYREMDGDGTTLPGSYRSDFYHNKMVVRNGLPEKGEKFLSFCGREETYSPVKTEKIYFEVFDTCEVARTRLYDSRRQVECDRSIVYIKAGGFYVMLDTVTAASDGIYTFGPVFFGDEAMEQAEGYILRTLEIVCDQPVERTFGNRGDYDLLVTFPEISKKMSTGKTEEGTAMQFSAVRYDRGAMEIRRSYHQENGIYQTFSGALKRGETVSMVSVLQPVKREERKESVKKLSVVEEGNGLLVIFRMGEQMHTLAFRNQMMEGYEKGIRKPEYRYERTVQNYGDLQTDALFSHIIEEKESVKYELLSFTRADYNGKTLWQVPHSSLIQGDWTLAEGVPEWNKWYGEIKNS